MRFSIENLKDGTVELTKDGLYWKVEAWIVLQSDRPVRLYAQYGDRQVPVGVFRPGKNGCTLSKRISARSLPVTEQMVFRTDLPGNRPALTFDPSRPLPEGFDLTCMGVTEKNGQYVWEQQDKADKKESAPSA